MTLEWCPLITPVLADGILRQKKISVLELTGLFIGDSKLHIFALAYQMEKALLATHQKYIGREALEVVV